MAGLELIRRIIGLAKAKDITIIEDQSKRISAEKFCLNVGKQLILQREKIKKGEDFLKIIEVFK